MKAKRTSIVIALTLSLSHLSASAGGNPPEDGLIGDCVKCHGTDGIGTKDKYPNLNCQTSDVLEEKMRAYVNGERKNRTMRNKIRKLDAMQLSAIAAYYAGVPCPD